MAISAGTHLGRYEIRSKIGAGGMGEVYLAEDTQLERQVALKVLLAEVANDEDRVRRFVQEAKAASALNHPNILTVHEIGTIENSHYIATEWIKGETLRERLKDEPLSLRETLDVVLQVAAALNAAHGAGIVHRDIKPENIMVRDDGLVKVLDFGLAKLIKSEPPTIGSGSKSDQEAETIVTHQTRPGVVLGTVAYMSPEQARGKETDARSDVWSLGVVMYEMLTQRMPFAGETPNDSIAAILTQEPAPLDESTPKELQRIVRKSLQKSADERYQGVKDLLLDVKNLKRELEFSEGLKRSRVSQTTGSSIVSTGQVAEHATAMQSAAVSTGSSMPQQRSSAEYIVGEIKRHRIGITLGAVLLLVVLIAGGVGLYKFWPGAKVSGPPRELKFVRLTTGGKIGNAVIDGEATISPDGRYVVFVTAEAGKQALWVRQVSTGSLVQIVPPLQGFYHGNTFSPDGEFVYATRTDDENLLGALFQVPVLGGTPRRVLTHMAGPITFSPDGKRFAFVRGDLNGEIHLMLANVDGSGEQKLATRKLPEGFTADGASWSPDGKLIACGVFNYSGTKSATVVGVSVDGGLEKPLTLQKFGSVHHVVWLGDGSGLVMTAMQEVSTIGTQIWFLSYPSGEMRRITNDLNGYGRVSLSVTADSSAIVSVQEDVSAQVYLTAPNEDSARARMISHGKYDGLNGLDWAPDGKIVYFNQSGSNSDLWTMNADGSGARQLMSDDFVENDPAVSPNGRYVLYSSNRSGRWNIWRIDADGNNSKQVSDGDGPDSSPKCSPDGKWIVFQSLRSGKSTLWKVPIDGGPASQLTDQLALLFSISPDGKFIAYATLDEQVSTQSQLVIIPFEGGPSVKSLSPRFSIFGGNGATSAGLMWTPDGRAITYADQLNRAGNLWSQPIDGGPPKQLTNFPSDMIFRFAWSTDGKQLAVSRGKFTDDVVLIKNFK